MDKILVSIPAWEDGELLDTLDKMLSTADSPELLVLGFGLNYEKEPDLSHIPNKKYIIRDKEDYGDIKSPGIIQIRNAIRRLLTDEKYYLSIDAHANFEPGWDTTLKSDMDELAQISDRFVISKQLLQPGEKRNYYTKWSKIQDGTFIGQPEPDFDMQVTRSRMVNNKYFLNRYLSGNFMFSLASWLTSMEFPDYHGFPYEEPELSLAAFCSGFDVVSPIGEACPISAGNDPKYQFPYDERWWELRGPDRNNPGDWQKKWVFDDEDMTREARQLLLTGENKYFSLNNLPRDIRQFYDTMELTMEQGESNE